jgi:hypothetical protein
MNDPKAFHLARGTHALPNTKRPAAPPSRRPSKLPLLELLPGDQNWNLSPNWILRVSPLPMIGLWPIMFGVPVLAPNLFGC